MAANDFCPELDKSLNGDMDNLVQALIIDKMCNQSTWDDSKDSVQKDWNDADQKCATLNCTAETKNCIEQMKNCIDTILLPMLNCSNAFNDALIRPQKDTCDDLKSATAKMTAGIVLMAVMMILGIFIQAHGAKAFIKKGQSKTHAYDGYTGSAPAYNSSFGQPMMGKDTAHPMQDMDSIQPAY